MFEINSKIILELKESKRCGWLSLCSKNFWQWNPFRKMLADTKVQCYTKVMGKFYCPYASKQNAYISFPWSVHCHYLWKSVVIQTCWSHKCSL